MKRAIQYSEFVLHNSAASDPALPLLDENPQQARIVTAPQGSATFFTGPEAPRREAEEQDRIPDQGGRAAPI
jgi:hypothetical protein